MDLKAKKVNIKDIKPASYNPRKISEDNKESLKNSIEEFGLVDPIIINLKTNNIIGGHQRFNYLYNKDRNQELILVERGDIGWVFTDEDLEIKDANHEKALNIALNKISGEWNINSLNNLLDDLKTYELDGLTGFDYSLDDFDYEYIPLEEDDDEDDYYDEEEEFEDNLIEEDEPEEVISVQSKRQNLEKPKTIIQKDTIYKNQNNIIYYGDKTKKNKETLLKAKITITEYEDQELELVESIPINYNYYITDSEETIKKILQETDTERIR